MRNYLTNTHAHTYTPDLEGARRVEGGEGEGGKGKGTIIPIGNNVKSFLTN